MANKKVPPSFLKNLRNAVLIFSWCVIGILGTSSSATAATVALIDNSSNPGPIVTATIPLPAGYLPSNYKTEPFAIDDNGVLKPMQTTVITRNPDNSVAVVKAVAIVNNPSSLNLTAGHYKVVTMPVIQQPTKMTQVDLTKMNLKPEVTNFLKKGALWLIANGPFNEQYTCNFLKVPATNIKTYEVGPTQTTVSSACDLTPVNGYNIANKKALPQLISARAFITLTSQSGVIDVKLLYGNTRAGSDNNVGRVYMSGLKLVIPSGYAATFDVNLPSTNPTPTQTGSYAVYDMVKPQTNKKYYVEPPGLWRYRHFAISMATNLAPARAMLSRQGLGVVKPAVFNNVETFSWQNPATAHYGSGDPLPNVAAALGEANIAAKWSSQWVNIQSALQTGSVTTKFEAGVLGDGQPYLNSNGGQTSGTEIQPIPSGTTGLLIGNKNSLLWNENALRGLLDRMPGRFYIEANGEPWSVINYLTPCTANGNLTGFAQLVKFSAANGTPLSDPNKVFGLDASKFDYHRIAAASLVPTYETTALSYQSIDYQHLIRFVEKLLLSVYYDGDPVALYLLRASAENVLASKSMFADNTPTCSAGGLTLLAAANYVKAKPHRGDMNGGREVADTTQLMAEAFATAKDDIWRNTTRAWLNIVSDTMTQAQTCAGYTMAKPLPQNKGLNPPYDDPSRYFVMQIFEEARIQNAYSILYAKVFNGGDAARANIVRTAQYNFMVNLINPDMLTDGPNGPKTGIPYRALVYDKLEDVAICPNQYVSGMLLPGNAYEIPNTLLTAYAWTNNPQYLTVANNNMPYSTSVMQDLISKLKYQYDTLWDSWASTALRVAQDKNVP